VEDQPSPGFNRNRQKEEFFYPVSRYRGEFTPKRLAFNANLQEFAQRVALLCSLETGGKITPQAAYQEIKDLWRQLKLSKKELLDQEKQSPPDLSPEE